MKLQTTQISLNKSNSLNELQPLMNYVSLFIIVDGTQ